MEEKFNGKAWLKGKVHERRTALHGEKPSNPYLCNEDFVLQNGREFQPGPYPKNAPRRVKKECFENAYRLSISDNNLRYVEGYARIDISLPLLHGWCIDENDKVVDPTWEDGIWYFGVVFELNYVGEIYKARKEYGVLEAYQLRFPLITGKHKYLGYGKVEYDRDQLLSRGKRR